MSWYMPCGEEGLSSTLQVTTLPEFTMSAVATPSHAQNVELEELVLQK